MEIFFYSDRLKTKAKVLAKFIREAQYDDGFATFSDNAAGLQLLLRE